MSWREKLLYWSGPGLLAGVTFGHWLSLLRENRFAVARPYLLRAAAITFSSLGNSLASAYEEAVYGRKVAAAEVAPPLFVLGIWRSGTTHLQNLFAVDARLATPTWYQVCYPHTFLSTERVLSPLTDFFAPERRLQDNVRMGFGLPSEDEFALCIMTGLSPMLSWVFPEHADHYDRFLTFRDASEGEIAAWKAALLKFVRKVTWKYRRPLVLKSPPHTARIGLLLDLFPDAKFVHIRRNPYAVIRSTVRMTEKLADYVGLQRPASDVEGRTIRQYREAYDAYFEQKALIPAGRLHELRFEDLEADPVGQLRTCYEALDLPDFAGVEADVRRYLSTLTGYRKNAHAELDTSVRERVARECRRCFEAWGYPA
jgi:hypothetical protein